MTDTHSLRQSDIVDYRAAYFAAKNCAVKSKYFKTEMTSTFGTLFLESRNVNECEGSEQWEETILEKCVTKIIRGEIWVTED